MDNQLLPSIVGVAIFTCGLAALFGYWMMKYLGAGVLAALTGLAGVLCYAAAGQWKWPGLLSAILLVAAGALALGRLLSGTRGARALAAAWLGWCALCAAGYLLAQIPGLFLISLPAAVLLWGGLYWIAPQLLPLRNPATSLEQQKALRALLTYTLGTNFTYYAIEDRKCTERVKGNAFRAFFAGPGLVLTRCDHTATITNNFKITQILEPGLTFLDKFERVGDVVDLRAQVRAFPVEAITRDGLRLKFITFAPFRIQAGAWPQTGGSFPFRKSAVFQATQNQLIEPLREQHDGETVENRRKHTWDEYVNIAATRIVRRIIGDYTFDELCAPYQPERDPRSEIINRFRQELKDELAKVGIEPLGGGVSNLLPADEQLLHQRVENWQAEWSRRITAEIGRAEAEYIRTLESARAQAQAEMIRTISEGFERAGTREEVSNDVLAMRFVEALEKMIKTPAVQVALPSGSADSLEAMKHRIESHRH
jgi:hypothetical protein